MKSEIEWHRVPGEMPSAGATILVSGRLDNDQSNAIREGYWFRDMWFCKETDRNENNKQLINVTAWSEMPAVPEF